MQKVVGGVAMFVGLVGGAGFLRGWNSGRGDLLQTSGAVLVASLALLGATTGLSTWRDERHRAREVNQRESYASLIEQTFARFAGSGFDAAKEAKLRAEIATWGDPKVVQALGEWNRAFDSVVPQGAVGTVALAADQQEQMRCAIATLIFAVREQLDVKAGATVDEIVTALFNDT